jgi:hypothetical protein
MSVPRPFPAESEVQRLMVSDQQKDPSTRARLIEARDLLKMSFAGADAKNLAALVKEYRLVLAAIDALPDESEVNPIDDLLARRKARSSTTVPKPPKRTGTGGARSD